MLQFVFLRVKVSVAAVKMESSISGLASEEQVDEGDGGGVRGAESMTLKKLSMPFWFGQRNWYSRGTGEGGGWRRTCSITSAELAICVSKSSQY